MFSDSLTVLKWLISAYVIIQITPWVLIGFILLYDFIISKFKNKIN